MPKTPAVQALITGMLDILQAVGVPLAGLTPRRAEKMALALLAVADIAPPASWSAAKGLAEQHRVGTKDIIAFRNQHFGENESRGSYDDVKRKDLLLPEQAYLVLPVSPAFAYVATNDPTRKYTLEPAFAALIRAYQTSGWAAVLAQFTAAYASLSEKLNQARGLVRVPIILPDGTALPTFGPGEHNQLQKAIIEDFLGIYVPAGQVLYIGDAENKNLHRLDADLSALGIATPGHEDLPDIIVYDPVREWVFIIEAVHSFGAISQERMHEIKHLLRGCLKDIVYVTAFLTREAFRPWAARIAWETEVWIAADPEHMIHFNGDRFLGPYKPGLQAQHRG